MNTAQTYSITDCYLDCLSSHDRVIYLMDKIAAETGLVRIDSDRTVDPPTWYCLQSRWFMEKSRDIVVTVTQKGFTYYTDVELIPRDGIYKPYINIYKPFIKPFHEFNPVEVKKAVVLISKKLTVFEHELEVSQITESHDILKQLIHAPWTKSRR